MMGREQFCNPLQPDNYGKLSNPARFLGYRAFLLLVRDEEIQKTIDCQIVEAAVAAAATVDDGATLAEGHSM
jgi:hypothetical protein